ncbi:sodium bile acid symporter family-domain-containing protein [Aspergillus germanicus]
METAESRSEGDNPPTNTQHAQASDIEKQGRQEPQQSSCSKQSAFKSLGILDRFLALWIFLAMAIGIILGNFVPNTGPALQRGTFVGVSVPIAVGLLVMMYPILCKVRYEALHRVFATREIWVQIGFSIVLALAWAFLPDEPELRQGLILVGLARCIAMVLIWTGLAGGDDEYCAILVAVNSLLQMVLFAPMAIFFIEIISGGETITLSYSTAAKSVAVFLGIPLGAAILTRFSIRTITSPDWYDRVFGRQVVHQIVSVVRVAAPLIVYFVLIFFVTLFITWKLGFGYKLAATQSFTAASNNFELAIAVAVATFGANSNQALASTVGPLIEVPVLLGLVYVVRPIARRVGWED